MTDKSDDQKDAESKVEGFKESLGPFVVAAETTRMAMVFADAKRPDNPIIFANDSFLSLTGYGRDEVLGKIEQAPDGNRLLLHWQERDGPPVVPPSHKGFGSSVIERGLAHELQGSTHLDYRPDGLVCTMNIPAPRGTHNG